MSRAKAYTEKRRKQAEAAIERELDTGADNIDFEGTVAQDTKDSAMGKGEAELYEKKLSKEEKKALAKAKREAKKKAKGKKGGGGDGEEKKEDDSTVGMSKSMSKMSMASMTSIASSLDPNSDEGKREAALEELSRQEIVVTYEQRKGNLHANTRDVNVGGVTVAFHGKTLIEETEVVINYGNRYGFIGPNGSGKSTVMKALAARSIPIPSSLDMYFLDCEYPSRNDITALEAVMESNDEVAHLEEKANQLNDAMAEADEDQQTEIQSSLEAIYDRLDQLDASTAEARATTILHGLGFTAAMMAQNTCEFSGG